MTESSIEVQLKYIVQRIDEMNKDVKDLTTRLVSRDVHDEQVRSLRNDISEIREATRFRGRRIQTSLGAAMLSAIGMAIVWLGKLF